MIFINSPTISNCFDSFSGKRFQLKKDTIKAQIPAGNITLESFESVGLKEKLLGVGGFLAGIQAVNSASNSHFPYMEKAPAASEIASALYNYLCKFYYLNSI